ncbi:hypothetical protein [Curtobacterium sp. MCSS17_007]|uniref:hypothetical protein n=1 Tax=Curtobacterium sp. MCSS17_007 TaxID=2175646 RepID=UPI000DA977E4|nr:hypothetical protein [Curtobacterium sp. MCSS17_007]WIE76154.1 hypothetical protein DEJ22_002505 [Curtobacterium sp. MCSS17_007]
MYRLGWQVLRGSLWEVVDSKRVRRALWIAAGIAAIALVLFVATDLAHGWAGPGVLRSIAAITFATLGVLAIAYSCFPTARDPRSGQGIDGKQVRPDATMSVRWSVQPYLERRARPIASEDRDDVLNDVPLLQRGLVRRLSRLGPLFVGTACGGFAVLVSGQVEVFVVLWPFVYLLMLPEMVLRLGYAERARLAALETEPPTLKHRPLWRRHPHGSKVRLPDE